MSNDLSGQESVSNQWEDELDPHIEDSKRNPRFRAAFEDAEELQRILDSLVGLRRQWALSQKNIADRMGVRQPTVSQFENEGNDPRLSTLQRYARAVEARLRLSLELPASCDWVPATGARSYTGVNSAPNEAHVGSGEIAKAWRVDESRRNPGWELAG